MSQTVIFIVGAIIFAVTVYGAVMAGGLALTQRQLDGDEDLRKRVDPDHDERRVPLRARY